MPKNLGSCLQTSHSIEGPAETAVVDIEHLKREKQGSQN